jgi:hypothetical protein
MCGAVALGALNGVFTEPLSIFSATARRALHPWKVHMGDILLWAVVGLLFVVAALLVFVG